jgi:DNA-directed RNA polymerase specialized sigma24 family protein
MDGRQALAALNREWHELASRPVPGWGGTEPVLAGVRTLAALLALIRERPDEVLAALLRLGEAGDPLAHRVVLQTMLGKLVLLCTGRPEALPDAISELWLAIAEYPLARRPRAIASNLTWAVRRGLPRPLPGRALAEHEPAAPATDEDANTVLAQARQQGLIDEPTHRTLWTVYIAGLSSTEAASALGGTPESVRWRCSWALRRLASHAGQLAA